MCAIVHATFPHNNDEKRSSQLSPSFQGGDMKPFPSTCLAHISMIVDRLYWRQPTAATKLKFIMCLLGFKDVFSVLQDDIS